jgi:predicted TIM-barrel fold metal-dependent hydrolase
VNPNSGKRAVQELENCLSRYRFYGLKLHPWLQGYNAASDVVTPLVEVCQSYDVPIYFHSGTTPYAQVYQIARHIRNNRSVRFILGHMGERYQWQDALEVARNYENAYLETSANMYSFAIERAVRNIGADRILFGTDIPFHYPGVELLKIRRLNISDEQKEWILSGTAAAVFGTHVHG